VQHPGESSGKDIRRESFSKAVIIPGRVGTPREAKKADLIASLIVLHYEFVPVEDVLIKVPGEKQVTIACRSSSVNETSPCDSAVQYLGTPAQ
jgi:hypothetical protein